MPSLSQIFGVKKGSDSSPSSRQGFFPFSRKWPSTSSRGRQHLRSKSDNSVVSSNGQNGRFGHSARSIEVIKRAPPVSPYSRDDREPYESRYERYRHIYSATSPERELDTLNAAVLNVRKWLKKKHQCLTSLQQATDGVTQNPTAGHREETVGGVRGVDRSGAEGDTADNKGDPKGITEADNKQATEQDELKEKQELLEGEGCVLAAQ